MSDLDARLLSAHAQGAQGDLVRLYCEAADQSPGTPAAWFYLTHAYVFALELGLPQAETLRARLVAGGRDRD